MNKFLETFLQTIRYRLSGLYTKFKTLTNLSMLRARVFSILRDFFSSLINVRPKDKNDYYTVFGWMISRKLAWAVIVALGMVGCVYMISIRGTLMNLGGRDGIKTYSYDSILLKMAKGKVRITGKSGYLAYEGEVSHGSVNGTGTLFNIEGVRVYSGDFVNNKYYGEGVEYYENGNIHYSGDFVNNMFEGSGQLFRSNGSKIYEGGFVEDTKEGDGQLFNYASEKIFTGRFISDEIVYSDLLGKSSEEIAELYTGERTLYEGEDMFAVQLSDINAMYDGVQNTESLEDGIKVDSVYVLKDYFKAGDVILRNEKQREAYFGKPIFEGTSQVTMAEAIAIVNNRLENGDTFYPAVDVTQSPVYDDYYNVSDFDREYLVYLYSYEKNGIQYTFVCGDRDKPFGFYYMNLEEGSDDK